MKDLLSGESMLFTELQNSALLKNYLHFEVWKFGRVSYKRGWLHWIFWYINFFQLLLHRQQIWSIFFSKFFSTFDFLLNLQEKIVKTTILGFSCIFFIQNRHSIKDWQYFWKKYSRFAYMSGWPVLYFSKIGLKMQK